MRPAQEAEFREFVAARREALLRTAYLVCGDWHRAEDAVQTSLVKLYGAWNRARSPTIEAYARKIVVRTLIDEGRKGWFRRERSFAAPPREPHANPGNEDRLVALAALAALPTRQRAALVLRFWEDLSVEETARALRCSTGTVKSQTARGLATLRQQFQSTRAGVQGVRT
ncbi:SigE family RNA polymerase sigma factor [Phytomonospora sp. NPDC050363]|uniref:SigE family RNA polymerase sigma factor n=1 Tax=Phytomonospora sp. NPDC050363 TaxID=3155642 RepID=UPI0033D8E9A7